MPKKNAQKKTLVLLDSHAILHRAYHALPDFASSKGEPTGALYGLVTMLLKIVAELEPDYIVAAYDLPGATYRHDAYEAYKAGRKKTEDALVHQIERSIDVFKAFGIPVYSKEGFEADDMLGTIVEEMKAKEDIDIVIASGDMDTLQLVRGTKVRVYTLKKGIKDTVIYDEKGVKARYGFGPELIPDYKGLRGDPSDNIIGVAGIGEKTATTLIQEFGTIEDLYAKLEKNEEAFAKAGIKPRIVELLKEHKEEAVFSKMLATIRRDAPIDWKLPGKEWKAGCELAKVKDLFAELEFRTLGSRVEGVLGGKAEATPGETAEQPGLRAEVGETVPREELERAQMALWLIDSNKSEPALDEIFEFTKTSKFGDAKDALLAEIRKRGLDFVYEKIELPLMPIVRSMEERGICVDTKLLAKLSKEYHTELDRLEKAIWKEAGEEFNINSPKQLGDILFDKLGLKPKNQKKTAGGARSTKESELEKMRDLHPVVPMVFEYREYQKLLSTYIDSIPDQVGRDGRLHARFHQAGTTTGRMSSSDPNLQNIPVSSELGRNIRGAFVATDGFKLVSLDYSQIELRIASFLSGDPKLIGIFTEGLDVHAAVAAQVFKVPLEEVTKEMRRRAKVINFGILYGMGVNALRANLGTDRKEAQEFYDRYFETFSVLADYLNKTKAEAARNGYVTTLFGRRRYFEGMYSPLPYIRASAERMAINAPMQGTQADLIKLAMVRIDDHLKKEGYADDAHLLLQVHDEVVYEIREKQVLKLAQEIKGIMEAVLDEKDTKGVPIIANAAAGERWNELEVIS